MEIIISWLESQKTVKKLTEENKELRRQLEYADSQYRRLEIQYLKLLHDGFTERDFDDGK